MAQAPFFFKRILIATLFLSATSFAGNSPYQLLRFNEDWSFLKEEKNDKISNFWANYKYTYLNFDKSAWLQVGGEMRNRLENWQSFRFNPSLNDTFDLWRLLVHSDLHVNSDLRIYIEGKSALASARNLPGGKRRSDVDELALLQGFFDVSPLSNNDLTIRIGRQQMAYGSYRLIAPAPWSNSMRTWDGVTVIKKNKELTVSAFATQFVIVDKKAFNRSSPSQRFYGVFSTLSKDSLPINFDFYWLFLHKEAQLFQGVSLAQPLLKATDNRNTLGGRIFSKNNKQYEFESAYQFGRWGSRKISAYFMAASMNHNFSQYKLRPSAGATFEIASGGKLTDHYTHTFNRIYPAGHRYLGFIDYISRQNIISPSLKASISPKKDITLGGAYNYFLRASTSDAVYMANGAILRTGLDSNNKHVGSEWDAYLKWKPSNQADLLVGYSLFLPGSFIKDTGDNHQSNFAYLQLTYKV